MFILFYIKHVMVVIEKEAQSDDNGFWELLLFFFILFFSVFFIYQIVEYFGEYTFKQCLQEYELILLKEKIEKYSKNINKFKANIDDQPTEEQNKEYKYYVEVSDLNDKPNKTISMIIRICPHLKDDC